uniref:Uncharacterized protein n=1 Tax=Heterorhabditis bacteriophora TaxID=37862 RepID=A0A1I7WQR4_HETBA
MGKTTLLKHIGARKLAIPSHIDLLYCEQGQYISHIRINESCRVSLVFSICCHVFFLKLIYLQLSTNVEKDVINCFSRSRFSRQCVYRYYSFTRSKAALLQRKLYRLKAKKDQYIKVLFVLLRLPCLVVIIHFKCFFSTLYGYFTINIF